MATQAWAGKCASTDDVAAAAACGADARVIAAVMLAVATAACEAIAAAAVANMQVPGHSERNSKFLPFLHDLRLLLLLHVWACMMPFVVKAGVTAPDAESTQSRYFSGARTAAGDRIASQ